MDSSPRSTTTLVLIVTALILATLAGIAIPLASGGLLGQKLEPWTPPAPTATPTLTPIPTRTATGTRAPTLTASPLPPTTTPTLEPARPIATPSSTRAPVTATRAPAERATTAAPTTGGNAQANTPVATVRFDPLALRSGPDRTASLIAVAKAGDTFQVLGRSADDAWLKVCCVNNVPVWLAVEFVDLSAPMTSFPVVEP